MNTQQEELKPMLEKIKEHNRIIKLSDDDLRDELIGVKNEN